MARGQPVVVKFTQNSLMAHAERLNRLLEPSWPNAGQVHEEIYNMVDRLMIHAVDQKWFSAFARIGEMEEMVTSQEIRAVSWPVRFVISAIPLTNDLCHHCHRQRGIHLSTASMRLIQNMSRLQ